MSGPAAGKASMPRDVVLTLSCGRLSGVDVFSVRLARELSRRGHRARILLADPDQWASDRVPLPGDVAIDRLPVGRWASDRRRQQALVDYLGQRHREHRGPVTWFPGYQFDLLWAVDRLPKSVRPVLVLHSDEPFYYKHALRWAGQAAALVAVSSAVARRLASHDPRLAGRTEVIAYGVPGRSTPRLPAGQFQRPLRVVYLGRFEEEQKRVLDLPEVIRHALARGVRAEFHFYGAGPSLGALRARLERLPKGASWRIHGPISSDETATVLGEADALVLPSAWEGLPLVVLEALGQGCVPVVSDLPTIPREIVDPSTTGLRVAPGDCEGFAHSLERLAGDAALRDRYSTAGPVCLAAEGLRLQDMADHYERLIQRVLDHGTEPADQPAPNWPRPAWPERVPRAARLAGNRLLARSRARGRTSPPAQAARAPRCVALFGSLPPLRGISTYCYEQAHAVARLLEVDYLTFRSMYPAWLYPGGGLAPDPTFPPIDDPRIRVHRSLNWYNPLGWWRAAWKTPGELLHAQVWSLPLLPAAGTLLAAMRLRGRPSLVTVHNADVADQAWAYRWGLALVLRLADGVVVHAPGSLDTLADRFGYPRQRMWVVPMGVTELYTDPHLERASARQRLGIEAQGPLILFFGAIRPYKGLDVLIDALAQVRREVPAVRLLVAGKLWEPWDRYQAKIDQLGLADCVHTRLEYIPTAEVKFLLAAADCVALPYLRFDAQSAVGMAALAHALPLVVSRVGGLAELVGRDDCIVPPGDPVELAKALARVLSDADFRAELSAHLQSRAAHHFDWTAVGAATVDIYRQLLA